MNGAQETATYVVLIIAIAAVVLTLIGWGITSTGQKIEQETQIIKTCAENGKATQLDKYEYIKGCK